MIKTANAALILGVALFPLVACQSAGQGGASDGSTAQGSQALPSEDTRFLGTAGTLGLEVARFARLTEVKAASPAVRGFATQLIADHSVINQHLQDLTQSHQLTPPSDMDGAHQRLYAQLESLSGLAVDRTYLADEMQDLTMDIQSFQAEADSGKDPQLRGFAQQNLPTLQQQLQTALKLTTPAL